MKVIVFILVVLIIGMAFATGLVMGIGKSKIIVAEITSEIINEAFELHGIDECILHKAEGNEPAYLYFYQGMKRIENPKGLIACKFFSNSLRNKYAEIWLENNEGGLK